VTSNGSTTLLCYHEKLNWLSEGVSVPGPPLEELHPHLVRLEEILAALEEQSDKEGLERKEKRLEEYKKKKYSVVNSPEEIREALMKNQNLAI